MVLDRPEQTASSRLQSSVIVCFTDADGTHAATRSRIKTQLGATKSELHPPLSVLSRESRPFKLRPPRQILLLHIPCRARAPAKAGRF